MAGSFKRMRARGRAGARARGRAGGMCVLPLGLFPVGQGKISHAGTHESEDPLGTAAEDPRGNPLGKRQAVWKTPLNK